MPRVAARRTAASLALVALLAGCGSDGPLYVAGPSATPSPDPLPAGWRWAGYGAVEVGVPAGWTDGLVGPWCLREQYDPGPIVGRPGPVPAVGCPEAEAGEPDPGTYVKNGGSFVQFAFGPGGPPEGPALEGDRATLAIAGVRIAVQAAKKLRERIIATIRVADPDLNGCPASDPISDETGLRPLDPVAVSELRDVVAVSACRYALPEDFAHKPVVGPGLLSSLRLTGDQARSAVAAVAAAPVGGGPNDAGSCLPAVSYGDEAIVLRIDSGRRLSRVYLRYSSCDHNGFDDGIIVRTLTPASARPFVTGPNQPNHWGGGGKLEILSKSTDLAGAREKCRCDHP